MMVGENMRFLERTKETKARSNNLKTNFRSVSGIYNNALYLATLSLSEEKNTHSYASTCTEHGLYFR